MKELALKTAMKIVDDLNDRSGFDLGSIDEDTQREIYDTWTNIILAGICAAVDLEQVKPPTTGSHARKS